MAGYLEDNKILELLQESEDEQRWSEDDARWSKDKQIELSSDDDGEIHHLNVEDLSSSDVPILIKIKILLPSLCPEIRKKIGRQLPIQTTLAELLLVIYIVIDQGLYDKTS